MHTMNSPSLLSPVDRSAEPNSSMPGNARRSISRREFLATGTLATSVLALSGAGSIAAESETGPRFPIIGFSKPFQKFTAEQTVELVAKVGWDGIECPVRAKGQ